MDTRITFARWNRVQNRMTYGRAGSHDHSVRLWDARVGRDAVMTMQHTGSVEDICWYPNARALVSCGGPEVIVWDVVKGASSFNVKDPKENSNNNNRLMRLTNHQKTVMTVNVHKDCGPRTSNNNSATDEYQPRLITGSLDGHVKVHEIDAFTVKHATSFPVQFYVVLSHQTLTLLRLVWQLKPCVLESERKRELRMQMRNLRPGQVQGNGKSP